VLVAHDKDFKNLEQFFPVGQRRQYAKGTGQIILRCRETRAVERLRAEWDYIEYCYAVAQRKGIRFLIRVTESGVNVVTNAPNVRTVEPR
jgi:hypothetical protein